MRAMKMMVMAMMLVALTAGFAVADVTLENNNSVKTDVTTNATANSTATGGNANATGGNSNIDFKNSYVNPVQPYNPNAPAPIQSGPELRIGEWGLFMPTLFVNASFEQASSLSDNYQGFFVSNRIGDEAIMTRNLKPTASIEIAKYWGKMPCDEYVASFPIFGKHGDQLEGLIGLALKRAMELGATKVGIMIRVIKEVNTKGLSMGTGAGVGLYIPCNSGVGTGVSFGAYISNTKTDDMYELNVVCLKGGAYVPPAPMPPVVKPAPAPCPLPEVCNPAEIFKRIEELKREVVECKLYCYNNLMLRKALVDAYIELYVCTNDAKYLKDAIYNAEIAERNYFKGHDIKAHKAEADAVISLVYYNQAGAIYEVHGKKVALQFAKAKHLERIPMGFAR